jgi:hypothetical protein
MLQRYSAKVQVLLDKAAAAREQALQSRFPEDKQFWLDMEDKWLALVRNVQHVDRISDFIGSQAIGRCSR